MAEELLAAGQGLSLLRDPGGARRDAREGARRGPLARYDGRWRDRDPSEAPPGVKPVIRLKAPLAGETVIEDQVQGRVAWQNENLDDLVLLRSDGTPTYMLAVVVDDHDMGVTHIIRGDDHLTNAARQKQIYDALGWTGAGDGAHPADPRAGRRQALQAPRRARRRCLPGDGLSAGRRCATIWCGSAGAHGDQEIFSTEEMIAAFDLPQIGRSPARFDFAKLESLNGHYIRQMRDAELLAEIEQRAAAYRRAAPSLLASSRRSCAASLIAAMPGLKERAKTLVELIDSARFLFAERPLALDDKAAGLLTAGGARAARRDRATSSRQVEPWTRGGDRAGGARLCGARGASSSARSRSRCAPR